MATVKLKFRSSSREGGEGTIFIRVIHNRKTRQIFTGFKLFPCEWDEVESKIITPSDCDKMRHDYLCTLRETVASNVTRLIEIIERLDRSGCAYSVERIVELFDTPHTEGGFVAFASDLIRQMKKESKSEIADKYATAINSFKRFRGERDVMLAKIDANLMSSYENWLKETGLCKNTTSFYMRNLRAIYNRAVDKEITLQRFPFRRVYTGVDKTVKRALSAGRIREIKMLDLSLSPRLDYARDLFMFSFYTRGMSFIDMAFLKKKDLQNGILNYRRKKTDQLLFIKWERPMQDIIEKYNNADSPYLLPIIQENGKDKSSQYRNMAHLLNIRLKKIGLRIGLDIPLTSYVARHSWASIAKSKDIPISTISEAMGHDSESTTRIYLSSLDTSSVDNANSIVMSLV